MIWSLPRWLPRRLAALALPCVLASGCGSNDSRHGGGDLGEWPSADAGPPDRRRHEAAPVAEPAVWDVDRDGVPPVVTADYLEQAKISEVSLFRSSMGHDYWDNFERCRSMKHYFVPQSNAVASTIAIRAPFDADVVRVDPEWAGVQLHLQSRHHPAFTAILFHVVLAEPLQPGQRLTAGQSLGVHVGAQTSSDFALAVATPAGRKLISYFEAMTDAVWEGYQQRGLQARRDLIITREARDADPLTCDGERFVTSGSLPQRIQLH